MRSCCDTAPAVRSISPRGTNKPFQFWLCPWLLTNTDIKKKVLEWIMACTAGPLSCSRIISMEPDRAGWRGWMQEKKAFHLGWKKGNTSRWTELFHYSWALQLVNVVICLWYVCGTRKMFSVWRFKLYFGRLHCPAASSQIQASSAGGTGIIPPFSEPVLSMKHDWFAAAILPVQRRRRRRRVAAYVWIMDTPA